MTLEMPRYYPVACHTDHITLGSTFVAIKGQHEDGATFITKAIGLGASKIIVQEGTIIPSTTATIIKNHGVVLEYVSNPRLTLAQLSAIAADHPARKLRIIGITGTKGKTTTSFLLEHILRSAGKKTALTGTVKNTILNATFTAPLTTPQPDYLQQFLKLCVQQDVEYVIMEIAAQGLSLHRVDGIQFDGIIFTNFSHEHLEFYETLQAYFNAKKQIFAHAKHTASLLINSDDTTCQGLLLQYPYASSFGIQNPATITGTSVNTDKGNFLQITNATQSCIIQNSYLMGGFNSYNILAAAGMASLLGVSLTTIADAVYTFTGVPGRLERYILKNGASCIIDYAHNPASYEAVLSLLRSQTPHLIVIFGAGGGRDKAKRPLMGKIASELADCIILTSDNPRYENPQDIITDILTGIEPDKYNKVVIQLDRAQAIHKAYTLSKPGSIIAILGKGPDEYQIIQGLKTPFSEKAIIQQLD